MPCLHRQDVLYFESLEFKARSNPHNKKQATDASLQVAEVVEGSKRRKVDNHPLCCHCHKPGHLIYSCWRKYPNKKGAFNAKKGGNLDLLFSSIILLPLLFKQCFRKPLITCLLRPPKRLDNFGNWATYAHQWQLLTSLVPWHLWNLLIPLIRLLNRFFNCAHLIIPLILLTIQIKLYYSSLQKTTIGNHYVL